MTAVTVDTVRGLTLCLRDGLRSSFGAIGSGGEGDDDSTINSGVSDILLCKNVVIRTQHPYLTVYILSK